MGGENSGTAPAYFGCVAPVVADGSKEVCYVDGRWLMYIWLRSRINRHCWIPGWLSPVAAAWGNEWMNQ